MSIKIFEDDFFSKGKKRNNKQDGKKVKEIRDRYNKMQKNREEDEKALKKINNYWNGKDEFE
jgi:hypothetical protein